MWKFEEGTYTYSRTFSHAWIEVHAHLCKCVTLIFAQINCLFEFSAFVRNGAARSWCLRCALHFLCARCLCYGLAFGSVAKWVLCRAIGRVGRGREESGAAWQTVSRLVRVSALNYLIDLSDSFLLLLFLVFLFVSLFIFCFFFFFCFLGILPFLVFFLVICINILEIIRIKMANK